MLLRPGRCCRDSSEMVHATVPRARKMRYKDAMSIKRSRQHSSSRRGVGDDADFDSPQAKEPEKGWEEQIKDRPNAAFAPYALTATYARGAFIVHPKFGKGVVTSVEGSHVVVLFAEGRKKLGHGKSAQAALPAATVSTEPGAPDDDPAAQRAGDAPPTSQSVLDAAGTTADAAAPPTGEPTDT